jgi:hypothetical protein
VVAPVVLVAVAVLAWLAARSMALAISQLVIGLVLVAIISVMTALGVPWPDVDSVSVALNPYFVATAALVLTAAGVIGAAVHARRRWSRDSAPGTDPAQRP